MVTTSLSVLVSVLGVLTDCTSQGCAYREHTEGRQSRRDCHAHKHLAVLQLYCSKEWTLVVHVQEEKDAK